tara:strand:+ start:389 stop:631 length:243 start_codon:yes stop_codon:yes gene_type:complete
MTTTAKKPRPARRRKPKVKTMTSETYQVSNKVSEAQLPVIITEQRRKLTELTPFELGLLPFLYLELLVKKVHARLSPKAS